jgi:hypothetical protein
METAVEAMESMEMDSGALPHPDRVPEQRLLSPKIGLQWWRHCGTFLGKRFYRRRGDVRGGPGGPHHTPARPRGGVPP